MPVHYEYVIETMDGPGDDAEIVEVNHEDTYALALAYANGKEHVRIALVRDAYPTIGLSRRRSWAYIEDGKLPAECLDAYYRPVAKVPKKYLKEVNK